MGLYILNISVDVPNYFVNVPDTPVSFNLQESIIEIVVEKVLGFENAIPETKDSDADSKSRVKSSFTVDSFVLALELNANNQYLTLSKRSSFNYNYSQFSEPPSTVDAPPPESLYIL